MKATWDKLEKNWMQFEVEVEATDFAKAVEAAFKRLNQRVTLPGFRKGKAPRALFERNYGKESLIQEAVDQLLPQAYTAALVEGQIDPIDQPEITDLQAEEGKPFVFKGKVQVVPAVTLGKLSGFGLEKPTADVTEAQIDEQVNALRERMATLVTDESGEVKEGSFAVIDFEGFLEGEAFEGGKAENYTLEIGSGSFIPGFEEQLIGAKSGEDREINVSFPEEYQAPNLAGKPATFKVAIKEIKTKQLPEANDEFAAEVSRFATVAELRADIEKRLKESAEANAERNFQNQVIEAVANDATVEEVPDVLIGNRIHEMIHDFEESLTRQGYSMEFWEQATGKTHEDLHKEFDEPARKSVKNDLVVAAVAKQESIAATDADLEAEFDKMVAMYQDQEKEINQLRKNPNYRSQMRNALTVQRTIEHLVSLNTPTEG